MLFKVLIIFLLFLSACSTLPQKVSPSEAAKIKKVTVISSIGNEVTVQHMTTSQKTTGVGGYEKDVQVLSWMTDLEIESAIGKELEKEGRKFIPSKLSLVHRVDLELEVQKIGNQFTKKALEFAKSTGADYAIIISPYSIIRRFGSFNGQTSALLLSCGPSDQAPRMATMFRFGLWNVNDKTHVAGSPMLIEAKYKSDISCDSLSKVADKNIEESYRVAHANSVKRIATECVQNSGIKK